MTRLETTRQRANRRGLRLSTDRSSSGSLCWPTCAPFVLVYLSVLLLFNTFGVLQLPPKLTGFYGPGWAAVDLRFYLFWHEAGPFGLSLVTALMSCNTLVALYLWACYRSEGRRGLGKRWFFLAAAVTLMMLQLLYWKLGVFTPAPIRLIPLRL
ncbi:MAG: hypothetical protein MPN21_16895 [Thermoanaerobaculia bacterium]|nr:hypothetical protein [Thermoanaerobaculia bacterium]